MFHMNLPALHDSINISSQYCFGYWEVIFFLADDLPLEISIEKSWKELLIFIFIYMEKHHFEHSVCLTKTFFTSLSWDSPSKEMCSLTIFCGGEKGITQISSLLLTSHYLIQNISSWGKWLITEISGKQENTGNFICLCFLDSSLKQTFPLLVPWRFSYPKARLHSKTKDGWELQRRLNM